MRASSDKRADPPSVPGPPWLRPSPAVRFEASARSVPPMWGPGGPDGKRTGGAALDIHSGDLRVGARDGDARRPGADRAAHWHKTTNKQLGSRRSALIAISEEWQGFQDLLGQLDRELGVSPTWYPDIIQPCRLRPRSRKHPQLSDLRPAADRSRRNGGAPEDGPPDAWGDEVDLAGERARPAGSQSHAMRAPCTPAIRRSATASVETPKLAASTPATTSGTAPSRGPSASGSVQRRLGLIPV
jgi:hypothetical protein